MMEKKLNLFNVAALYVGTIMGAGFASGREGWQFFGVFGAKGYIGITIAGLLFMGIGMMVAVKVLLGFLFGSAWALVGLAFAVWMPNKYVSMTGPFVLYESLYILMPDRLNPAILVRGDDVGHLLSVVLEGVWIFAAAAVVMAGFKRRCRDE